MKFICDQNWDAMTITNRGRFCEVCKKEVLDYTTIPINKVRADSKATNNNLCGRFTIEQVDPSIIKQIEVPRQLKLFALLSSLLLTVSTKTLFGQTKNNEQTEQYESKGNSDTTNIKSIDCDTTVKIENEPTEQKLFLTTNRRFYYWTKNFHLLKV